MMEFEKIPVSSAKTPTLTERLSFARARVEESHDICTKIENAVLGQPSEQRVSSNESGGLEATLDATANLLEFLVERLTKLESRL